MSKGMLCALILSSVGPVGHYEWNDGGLERFQEGKETSLEFLVTGAKTGE